MTSKSVKTVTLKRTVTVNAIVTNNLKKLLVTELQEAERAAEARMAEIEKQANHLISEAQRAGNHSELATLGQQLAGERQQYQLAIREYGDRKEMLKTLKLGDLFDHGTIEGFVSVQEGDNLYEKLSATSILIEDGIVQKIESKPSTVGASASDLSQ